jgi:hypothetical protein
MAVVVIEVVLSSLQDTSTFQYLRSTARMKTAFTIAVAALLLENAAASPLNIEARQVSSTWPLALTTTI